LASFAAQRSLTSSAVAAPVLAHSCIVVLTKFNSAVVGIHSAVNACCWAFNAWTPLTNPKTVGIKLAAPAVPADSWVATGAAFFTATAACADIIGAQHINPAKNRIVFFISLDTDYIIKNNQRNIKIAF